MSKPQTLARFHPSTEQDFFKCLLLFERMSKERDKNPTIKFSKSKISNLKRSLDLGAYANCQGLTLAEAERVARAKNFRLRIWKQKDYKSPVFLEFEAQLSEGESENLQNFDFLRYSFFFF